MKNIDINNERRNNKKDNTIFETIHWIPELLIWIIIFIICGKQIIKWIEIILYHIINFFK